jgi:hypothetical protein
MKQKNDDIKTKDVAFEKPVRIIVIVITIVTMLLIIEALYNHSNAVEQRENLYEMKR